MGLAMNRLPAIAFAGCALIALPAWTMPSWKVPSWKIPSWKIDVEPLSLSVGGVAETHPDPKMVKGLKGAGWREINTEISQSGLGSIARWQPRFFLRLDDCAGNFVDSSDLYFGGTSTGALVMDEAALKAVQARGEPIRLTSYIVEKRYQDNAHLCASFAGGDTVRGEVKPYCFRLKPEPVQALGLRGSDPPHQNGPLTAGGLCGFS